MSTSNDSYHHGSLREALVEAGLSALEGHEGKDVSLRELARSVGVTPTAVYRHFPDKKALMKALEKEGIARLGKAQAEAARLVGGGAAGFAETGRAYVRFALAHPALFRLMFTQGDPVAYSDEDDLARDLLAANALALAGDPDEAERLALQAWAIAHGIAMLMLDGRIPANDGLIDRLVDIDSLFPIQGRSKDASP